jgi:hypothetical protein
MLGRVESKGGVATIEVGAESAELLPAEFDALTETTSAAPASFEPSVYVWLVAPEMSLQFEPLESQCRHRYA